MTTGEIHSLPLALTMGEPAGIGTEITLKAYQFFKARNAPDDPAFFVIDDPARVAKIRRDLNADLTVSTISAPEEASSVFPHSLPILPLTDLPAGQITSVYGQPDIRTALTVIASIEQATKLALSKKVSGVVTNPIQKEILINSGFSFPGHTEYLGNLTTDEALHEGALRGPVMMLAGQGLKVVPVTIHTPLSKVPGEITTERIFYVSKLTAQALVRDFGLGNPTLAVCGLNPHAGENGKIGTEDLNIIAPAVKLLQKAGINAVGPIPADTMFHEEARTRYHVAIAMYHDQGLIPIKTIDFFGAVNITLGLPIIRTSPDHGTGLAIAGKGMARPDSLIQAILMAHNMYKTRRTFDQRQNKNVSR